MGVGGEPYAQQIAWGEGGIPSTHGLRYIGGYVGKGSPFAPASGRVVLERLGLACRTATLDRERSIPVHVHCGMASADARMHRVVLSLSPIRSHVNVTAERRFGESHRTLRRGRRQWRARNGGQDRLSMELLGVTMFR